MMGGGNAAQDRLKLSVGFGRATEIHQVMAFSSTTRKRTRLTARCGHFAMAQSPRANMRAISVTPLLASTQSTFLSARRGTT